MKLFLNLSVCGALLCGSLCAHAQLQTELIVVTDQDNSVYNLPAGTRVIELDAAVRLHDQLSADLPDNPAQAETVARARLENSGKQFQLAMQSALQGAVDAWTLGVSKLPAVVFDGHVVYGEPDVHQAQLKITAYQQREQNTLNTQGQSK